MTLGQYDLSVYAVYLPDLSNGCLRWVLSYHFRKITASKLLILLVMSTFKARKLHVRDAALQLSALQSLGRAFVEKPETILQELVKAAVDVCGADSSGISIEREDRTDKDFYHWVATAGDYSGFLNAILPRYPSACGVCLERGRPQLFRVSKRFFDILGVEAPLVTDGILLPWEVDGLRGTIFVMAHGRDEAFDTGDVRIMEMLARFCCHGLPADPPAAAVARTRTGLSRSYDGQSSLPTKSTIHSRASPMWSIWRPQANLILTSRLWQSICRPMLEDFRSWSRTSWLFLSLRTDPAAHVPQKV